MLTSLSIQPYIFREQEWPQDTLTWLWTYAMQDRENSLLWREGTPLTLNQWIRWFTDPERLVILPVQMPSNRGLTVHDVMGMAWVDEVDHARGTAHFWFRQQPGTCRPALRAGIAILDLLFDSLKFAVLICRLNPENKVAVKCAKYVGFQMIGDIPGWYTHGETRFPARIGYMTAAMFHTYKEGRQYAVTVSRSV